MRIKVTAFVLGLTLTACAPQSVVTEAERQAAIHEISIALDSMNEAWRRADFPASMQWMLDEGLSTFNGDRSSIAALRSRVEENPSWGLAGQYISEYEVRYDVLSPNVVITSWENDFARILPDNTQEPMQVALMTLVWKRTDVGWRILHYHESTRPKERAVSSENLSQ